MGTESEHATIRSETVSNQRVTFDFVKTCAFRSFTEQKETLVFVACAQMLIYTTSKSGINLYPASLRSVRKCRCYCPLLFDYFHWIPSTQCLHLPAERRCGLFRTLWLPWGHLNELRLVKYFRFFSSHVFGSDHCPGRQLQGQGCYWDSTFRADRTHWIPNTWYKSCSTAHMCTHCLLPPRPQKQLDENIMSARQVSITSILIEFHQTLL